MSSVQVSYQRFMNAVALRVAPPRSSVSVEKPVKPAPVAAVETDAAVEISPLAKLKDFFR